jgi:hypothetical protein
MLELVTRELNKRSKIRGLHEENILFDHLHENRKLRATTQR